MAFRDESTALAANWRTILAVDAVIGWAALIIGLVVASTGATVIGSLLVGAGAAYLVLNFRRMRRWKRLRTDAGL
jgi:Flp pilus assembly protein TadB